MGALETHKQRYTNQLADLDIKKSKLQEKADAAKEALNSKLTSFRSKRAEQKAIQYQFVVDRI